MNRYEHFQKNMQNKYNNIKQHFIEKIKKYVERFDIILKRLKKFKRRDNVDELQNFIRDFRRKHQIKLFEHSQYTSRRNLKVTMQRLENVEFYLRKNQQNNKKKNKNKKFKRFSDYIENFKKKEQKQWEKQQQRRFQKKIIDEKKIISLNQKWICRLH